MPSIHPLLLKCKLLTQPVLLIQLQGPGTKSSLTQPPLHIPQDIAPGLESCWKKLKHEKNDNKLFSKCLVVFPVNLLFFLEL